MTRHALRLPLLAAIALAGCQNPSLTPPIPAAASPQPQSLADLTPVLPVIGVRASSVNDAPALSPVHVYDQNADTAWGPNASDTAPYLIFQFAQPVRIQSLRIQLAIAGAPAGGHDVRVDGEIVGGGSTWLPMFTGFCPTEGQAEPLSFQASSGTQCRLRFDCDPKELAALRVDEVQLYGTLLASTPATPTPAPTATPGPLFGGFGWLPSPAPTPARFIEATPSPTPTPTPTPTPSPTATPTPTPTPTPSATGTYTKLVGSGWMQHANWLGPQDANAVQVQFEVHVNGSTQQGALALQDLGYGQTYKGVVTSVSPSADGTKLTLAGTLAGSGEAFSATVTHDAAGNFTHFSASVNAGVVIDSDVSQGTLGVTSVSGPEDLSGIQALLQ